MNAVFADPSFVVGRLNPRHALAESARQQVACSDDLLNRGITLDRDRADTAWSLIDGISFLIMKDLEITEALTSDHDFRHAGLVPLF